MYLRPAGENVTVEPSEVDKLAAVNAVAAWTALALIPFVAAEPPTVELNINTDLAYATDGADKPNVAVLVPVILTFALACNQSLAMLEL